MLFTGLTIPWASDEAKELQDLKRECEIYIQLLLYHDHNYYVIKSWLKYILPLSYLNMVEQTTFAIKWVKKGKYGLMSF